jgi:pSer/pThr/pTyr-binding forkhead associated (FHA) protein
MAIVLLIKTSDDEVSDLPVLNKIVLGRSSSSDFKVSDEKMSGMHCSFEVTSKGQLLFKDLGSTNGSFLNNSDVQEVHVKINDIIRVGDTQIKIDEKRLTPSDRKALGTTVVKKSNDKTLPALSEIGKSYDDKEESSEKEPAKKKVIGLSPQMKAVKEKEKESREKNRIKWGSTKNILEREKSSGNTKFLKLSEEEKAKKKK